MLLCIIKERTAVVMQPVVFLYPCTAIASLVRWRGFKGELLMFAPGPLSCPPPSNEWKQPSNWGRYMQYAHAPHCRNASRLPHVCAMPCRLAVDDRVSQPATVPEPFSSSRRPSAWAPREACTPHRGGHAVSAVASLGASPAAVRRHSNSTERLPAHRPGARLSGRRRHTGVAVEPP